MWNLSNRSWACGAWEHRYNLERFSMALNGLTPAEKLATFTAAASPLHSTTVPQSPFSVRPSASDRLPIAAPVPNMQASFSHNHDRDPGATS